MKAKTGNWVFCPRPITSLLTLLFFILFVSLGFWQIDRAEQKRSQHSFFEKRQIKEAVNLDHDTIKTVGIVDLVWRKVNATGNFLEQHQILLDNQVHAGQAGYYVYTPFRLEDSEDIILVNRGWVSTNNDRNLSPRLIMTKGMISINGVIKEEPRTGLLLTKEHVEKLSETITRVQRLTIAEVSDITRIKLLPFIMRLSPESKHGYTKKQQPHNSGENVHMGYAYQWFAFAIMLLAIYLIINIEKRNGAT